jgi:tetratricopeptide (TPR) repeat protein
MSSFRRRFFTPLQQAMRDISQSRQPQSASLTAAMSDQFARARTALAEGRAQDIVDDTEASIEVLVLLLSATQATIGSAYHQLQRERDRDQAFRRAAKFFEVTKAPPGPAEILAIVPALDARGKRDLAIQSLRTVAASYPGDIAVARELANELEAAGDPAAASAYAQLARRLGPADVAEQIRWLRKATGLDGDDPELRASLGEALLRAGDAEGAVTELRAATARLPLDHDANVWLAEAVHKAGSPQDALSIVDAIAAKYPDKVAARLVRANICSERGELAAAMADVDHAVELDPGSVSARRTKARLLARLGRYQEAIAAFDAVLAEAPDDAQALLSRGKARYAEGEPGESVRDFAEAAKMAEAAGDTSLKATALAWQGEALRLLNRYSEALIALDEALAAGPPSGFTLGTKGQVLAALGRRDEATQALTAAADDPGLPWVHAALADIHRLEHRWGEALGEVELASADGETTYTHFLRGQILAGMGDSAAAAEELRTAWTMQPSPMIAEELASLLALLGRPSDLEESLAVMDATLSEGSATRSLRTKRAETLRMLGRASEALAAIDELLEDGEDVNVSALKALVLAELGRGAEALELANAVLDRDPESMFGRCAKVEAYMAKFEYEEALDAVDLLLADTPGQPFAVTLKGAILCHIARFQDAVETLRPTLNDNPNQPFANALAGYALRRQEPPDLPSAINHFSRSVQEDPDEDWYQIELADILHLLDREPEARRIRQQIFDHAPTGNRLTARNLGYSGWAALFLDRPDDAVTLIGEGVQLDSEDLPLRFAFAFALLHADRDELALDEYAAAIAACAQLKSKGYRTAILGEALSDLKWARQRGRLDAVLEAVSDSESLLSTALNAKE